MKGEYLDEVLERIMNKKEEPKQLDIITEIEKLKRQDEL